MGSEKRYKVRAIRIGRLDSSRFHVFDTWTGETISSYTNEVLANLLAEMMNNHPCRTT